METGCESLGAFYQDKLRCRFNLSVSWVLTTTIVLIKNRLQLSDFGTAIMEAFEKILHGM